MSLAAQLNLAKAGKAGGMTQLGAFGFKFISAVRRVAEKRLDDVAQAEKMEAEQLARTEREIARKDALAAKARDIRKRMRQQDEVPDLVDASDDEEDDNDYYEVDHEKAKATRSKRPPTWNQMGEYAFHMGIAGAKAAFRHEPGLIGLSDIQLDKKMSKWSMDYNNNKTMVTKGRKVAVGDETDKLIKAQFVINRDAGLPVDNETLQRIVREVLVTTKQSHLHADNGGPIMFGKSWCDRFWVRHNIPIRAATTKMRVAPVDHDEKKEVYVTKGAKLIAKHGIRPELVVGFDETMIQLVVEAKKTRNAKGAKRVRTLSTGHGKDHQLTSTIFITEASPMSDGYAGAAGVLTSQIIFAGKTDRCHVNGGKTPAPPGLVYSHSESHWQTPGTMKECVIKKVLVPWRKTVILKLREEGIPVDDDAKAMAIVDLHHSHFEKSVLEAFEAAHFVLLFIPAGETDEYQICDSRANKPYKGAFRQAFDNWSAVDFAAWRADNPGAPAGQYTVNYKASNMKPQLPTFALAGMAALKTQEMRVSLARGYKEEGCLAEMRSEARQSAALVALEEDRVAAAAADAAEAAAEAAAALAALAILVG
jgi:DDE superfamily endonuclease